MTVLGVAAAALLAWLLVGAVFTVGAALENRAHLYALYTAMKAQRGAMWAWSATAAGAALSALLWPRLVADMWRAWRRPYRRLRQRQLARQEANA